MSRWLFLVGRSRVHQAEILMEIQTYWVSCTDGYARLSDCYCRREKTKKQARILRQWLALTQKAGEQRWCVSVSPSELEKVGARRCGAARRRTKTA